MFDVVETKWRRTLDGVFLERKRAERDVQRNTGLCLRQHDAMLQCELAGIVAARPKAGKQSIDKDFLFSKSSQQREIGVFGQPRFTPALHGDPADEAVFPRALLAESLQFQSGGEDRIQEGLSF